MIKMLKYGDHEDWLKLRHQYIGGSDAAAVVGLNQYVSPFSLWCEKTDRLPGFEGNLATRVGTFMEEFVAEEFCRQTGKKVRRRNQSFFNSDYPWAIANIDREIVGEDAGLEIKTTSDLCLSKFKNGEYPSNYYVQSMHYMAVTGKAKWYLAVLIGNHDFRIFEIQRDEDEIKALMDAEKSFWDCVKTDKAPPVDGNRATGEALEKLYEEDGSEVDLTPVSEYLRLYKALKAQKKELEEKIGNAENHVKQYMGTAGKGTYGDEFKVTWRNQKRNTLDKKRLQAEHPEINLNDYMNTSESRVFRFN